MYEYKANVIEVYDGDTVTLDIDLGCHVWIRREKCRLFGINTPEVRGPKRPKGLIARDALRAEILGKDITICTHKDKSGKYGRLLVDIYLEEQHINKWLVDNNFAEERTY